MPLAHNKMGFSEDILDLQPGDWIIRQDEEIKPAEGGFTFVTPGMVGKVLSMHPDEDLRQSVCELVGQPIPLRALVEFEKSYCQMLCTAWAWKSRGVEPLVAKASQLQALSHLTLRDLTLGCWGRMSNFYPARSGF